MSPWNGASPMTDNPSIPKLKLGNDLNRERLMLEKSTLASTLLFISSLATFIMAPLKANGKTKAAARIMIMVIPIIFRKVFIIIILNYLNLN